MARIRIGTSGWSYSDWKGPFYEEDTRPDGFLSRYAARFDSTEINNTFYSLPESTTVESWLSDTPDAFLFAVKASRYITHNKKLKDPEDSTRRFFKAIEPLEGKCGPILFQLPPNWNANAQRLEAFIAALPKGRHRYVFEFRDRSWLDEEIYAILRDANAALCIYDLAGYRSPEVLTADFTYMRLHGPEKSYEGSYDGRRLAAYARKFQRWAGDGHDVYCYFDNDKKACAPLDALDLLEKTGNS